MRKIILFATLILIAFPSCQKSKQRNSEYDYVDFDHLQIQWKDLFTQEESFYYVYFYSEQCYYCESFKSDFFDYISTSKNIFFLLSYQPEIPIKKDIDMTIGAESLDKMWFGGTPSLIYLENNVVKDNVLGVQNISSYLKLI